MRVRPVDPDATRKKHSARKKSRSTGKIDRPQRGHDGSSSRRKFATNTRNGAVNNTATKEDIVTNSRRESSKNTKACSKSQQQEDNDKIEKVLPWLPEFKKDMRSCAGSRNYQHLIRFLSFYTQNVLSSVAGSSVVKINLKNQINNMLLFFHLYWLDIKQDIADHSEYLNKISALLNVYIDMELKTSMEKRTSHIRNSSEIAAKILAALYIYLNNSEEHIFRVLLRIKHMTEKPAEYIKYTEVCCHIFTKSFTNLKTKTTPITDVAYIRYLLVFKIWRRMEEDLISKKKKNPGEIERIDKLAPMLLGLHMPKLQNELLKFVPTPPMGQENETLWLIQSNLHEFDIEKVHEKFLLFEDQEKMNKIINRKNRLSRINQLFKTRQLEPGAMNKIIEIDLTNDDEISKVKRKKTRKRKKTKNSECLKVTKNIREKNVSSKKHINSSKYSGKLVNADVKEWSNKDNKSLGEKIRLDKPIYDIKISNSTENYISVSSRSSLNDVCHINPQKNVNVTKNESQMSNTCLEFVAKEDEKQAYNLHYLKESKLENCVSSYVKIGNVINSHNNLITQNKEALTSQEENAMETIPLFKTCQNNIADQHSFKQELSTSTNCSAMQKSHKCTCVHCTCNTMPVYVHDIKHLIYHSSQITEIMKQVNECSNCCTDVKTDCKPFMNHDEHVMTVQAEKRVQRLDKSNDTCTVSTTSTEDQIVKLPLYNQHVNDNVRMNDYDNTAKYSKAAIKEQQNRTDCDYSILNDRLHSLESCGINFFDIGSNAKIDNDRKSFPKIEKADEITKTDYVDDSDINFLNNIQSKTLEDFFQQSSEQPQINDDDSTGVPTKEPLPYTDNNITVASQENNVKIYDVQDTYDVIYMLSDKCIHVTNHTGEHIMTTSANDMCTVSTTFTGDQIAVSSLDSQHCTFDIDLDLKEASEMMKTESINDSENSENISFLHPNIQPETLGDMLDDTNNFFLPLKQSLFELDNVYSDASSSESNVLCNNQNDAIDSIVI